MSLLTELRNLFSLANYKHFAPTELKYQLSLDEIKRRVEAEQHLPVSMQAFNQPSKLALLGLITERKTQRKANLPDRINHLAPK